MSGFSYEEIGCTRPGVDPPPGFHVHHRKTHLGSPAVWDQARSAVDAWTMFAMDWVRLEVDGPPETGRVAVVHARVGGLLSLANACRVIETYDTPHHYGFIYGTLDGHSLRGEERFSLHLTPEGVVYEILAYSRPASLLAKLGLPVVRALQYRFGTQSIAAMRRAVSPA